MKEYAIFAIAGLLLASVVFGGIYSEVAKAITGISTAIERAVPHE
ncbi:MAG: hypothetical protein ACREU9_00075 [Gammaproteobacteria bacterium]